MPPPRGVESSEAIAINERGQVTGNSGDHAFLWEKGKMTDLGAPRGGTRYVTAINERGQIIGLDIHSSGAVPTHSFLWQDGKMTNLDGLAGGTNFYEGFNNHNQIVGWATTKNGQRHAVLWTLKTGG